jgi:hypothetical protein
MASRRTNQISANLGSGARTTTGGSYTNPRLGIEDYTAFGRGMASTFRVPEQKTKKDPKIIKIDPITLAKEDATEQNAFFSEKDEQGNIINYSVDEVSSKNFLRIWEAGSGEYSLPNMAQAAVNALPGSVEERKLSNNLNGFNKAFGQKDSNLSYIYSKVTKPGEIDYLATNELGGLKLPGANPREESNFTINDMNKGFYNGTLEPHVETYNGVEYHGVRDVNTKEFINLEAADKNWTDSKLKPMYDVSSNIMVGYDSVKNMNFNPVEFTGKTFQDKNNKTFQVTNERSYYQKGDLANFERKSNVFSNTEFFDLKNSNELPSARRQIIEQINSGNFSLPTDESEDKFNVLKYRRLITESDPKTPGYSLLQKQYSEAIVKDYLNENFKLSNGSDYYTLDDRDDSRGRAVAKTIENASFFEVARTEQKPEDEASFTLEDTTKLASEIKSYFTEGVLGEDRKRLIDKSIKIPGFKEGVITNVTGSAGSLNIEYIDADFEKYEDDAGEPIKKSKTYDLRSVEDLLEHTNYLSLPLLKGQSNAKNRDSLLKELNK